ncbi:MAG: copper chaperone PCu(A)C [Burkholderiales bacterium]|nr:copper chaperone PCu(A)C [Burkholderiales bacterium]
MSFSSAQMNAAESKINVSHAWVKEAPPNAEALAGYMDLQNQTLQTQTLLRASSADFKSVMLHQTVTKRGMAHMNHTPLIEIKAGSTLQLTPGGYHLMLMNPKKPLRQGDQVQITLEFQSGLVFPVIFRVSKAPPK